MNILLFGAGAYYRKQQENLKKLPDTVVIGFLDNNPRLWGREIDGVPVYSPEDGIKLDYDKILLMSLQGNEMDRQLQMMGVAQESIMRYEEYRAYQAKGEPMICYGGIPLTKGVLVISTDLGYNGGSLAALYAAAALKKRGYSVTLAAPNGDENFIREALKQKLPVILYTNIKFEKLEDMSWMEGYDYVLVNTFQMYPCMLECCGRKNTVWWLHEPAGMYEGVLKQYPRFSEEEVRQCKVLAVSEVARESFHRYFPNINVGIMPYGCPDTFEGKSCEACEKKIFAVIGNVCDMKGQDTFIQAADLLTDDEKNKAEFWIVGKLWGDAFGEKIEQMAASRQYIKLVGEKSRTEILSLYRKISVVTAPSRQDTLSMAVTEGMMWEKVCIVSEAAGIARYIENGKNGLLCKADDAVDLSSRMKWVLGHGEWLEAIGKNARLTYEKFFTMEMFGERLERILHKEMP